MALHRLSPAHEKWEAALLAPMDWLARAAAMAMGGAGMAAAVGMLASQLGHQAARLAAEMAAERMVAAGMLVVAGELAAASTAAVAVDTAASSAEGVRSACTLVPAKKCCCRRQRARGGRTLTAVHSMLPNGLMDRG